MSELGIYCAIGVPRRVSRDMSRLPFVASGRHETGEWGVSRDTHDSFANVRPVAADP